MRTPGSGTARDWRLTHPVLTVRRAGSGASAAFDPLTAEVLLFGGRLANGDGANDTWAWDGMTWRDLAAGSGGPLPGEGSAMAWDSATEEMVLVTAVSEGGAGGLDLAAESVGQSDEQLFPECRVRQRDGV